VTLPLARGGLLRGGIQSRPPLPPPALKRGRCRLRAAVSAGVGLIYALFTGIRR